jgi:17beta-estradiol 17-dehydrogenase / very-long-chain 3-oxoacyl-CoA reductase
MLFLSIFGVFALYFLWTKFVSTAPLLLSKAPKECWALVTGATDGIGLEFAKQLAEKGYKIMLVSRTAEKLEKVAEELSVETRVVACDLTGDLSDELVAAVDELKPLIVVNNAGMSYPHAEYVESLDTQRVDNMVNINCRTVVALTRLCIPHMKEAKSGVIINLGSGNGRLACGAPLYSVYSATKAFVDVFSRAMHYEVREFGIAVQCVIPYYVATKMSRMRASFTVPTAQAFVQSILKGKVQPVSVPYWVHSALDFVLSRFPCAGTILGMNKGIRKKALERNKKK